MKKNNQELLQEILKINLLNKIKLINIYVPNGNPINTEKYQYKKKWLNLFNKKIKKHY